MRAEWFFPERWPGERDPAPVLQRPVAAVVLRFPTKIKRQGQQVGLAGGCQVIPLRALRAIRWGATDAGY